MSSPGSKKSFSALEGTFLQQTIIAQITQINFKCGYQNAVLPNCPKAITKTIKKTPTVNIR